MYSRHFEYFLPGRTHLKTIKKLLLPFMNESSLRSIFYSMVTCRQFLLVCRLQRAQAHLRSCWLERKPKEVAVSIEKVTFFEWTVRKIHLRWHFDEIEHRKSHPKYHLELLLKFKDIGIVMVCVDKVYCTQFRKAWKVPWEN